jgi:hypothetical protein
VYERTIDFKVQIQHYNFGGRSPAEAMREDAWNHFIRTLPDSPWPRTAWKSGGKYVQLPMTIDLDPKPIDKEQRGEKRPVGRAKK